MAWAEISHVNEGAPAGGGNFNTTPISTIGANLIVINRGWYAGGTSLGNPQDNQSNTYTNIANTGRDLTKCDIWYCFNPTTNASHTFSPNTTGAFPVIQAIAFSGAVTSPVDQTASGNSAAGANCTTSSITPTLNGELIVSSCATSGTSSGTPACTNLTLTTYAKPSVGFANIAGGMGYQVQSTAAAIFATWSGSSTDAMVAFIVSLKTSASGTMIINSMFF